MLYIITEDSNSARDFWKCVADTFRGQGKYIMVALPKDARGNDVAGNTTLDSQVISVFPQLQSGDELFVVFDNVANNNGFNVVNFINKVTSLCNSMGIKFKYTGYYCFEEVYLSYTELIRMYSNTMNKDIVVLNTLKYVFQNLQNGTDYYMKSNRYIEEFLRKCDGDAGKNREHFANQLLIEATKLIKGHFKIIKTGRSFFNRGECWLMDCSSIQHRLKEQHRENMCNNQCDFCCKYSDTKDKLLDLEQHSICEGSGHGLSKI